MKNFHVVDSASHAYDFVWSHKAIIARYAVIPFLVKIGCLALIILMGLSDNHLRQGLLLLPAHFTEGWFTLGIVMLCMKNIQNRSSKIALLPAQTGHLSQQQRLHGSIALYVLIQIVFALIVHALTTYTPLTAQAQGAPTSPKQFVLMLALLAATVWAFRFTLIHIPVAMGYGLRRYIRVFHSYNASLRMIGLTMLCTIPAALVMIIMISFIGNALDVTAMNESLAALIFGTLQTATQMIVLALTATAMTYAFYPHLSGKITFP